MKVDRKRVARLLRAAVAIDTTNPPGNEKRLAAYLQAYLRQNRIPARVISYFPGRFNCIAHLRSSGAKKTLIVSPHLDTVPASPGLLRPYARDGKLYGRGTTDCKGNLCALVEAMIVLRENGPLRNLDIVLCATADEEAGSKKGLIPLLEHGAVKGDFWLILDSDDFQIITAQKGLLHLRIVVRGRSAHASVPHKGKNAILLAGQIMRGLADMRFTYTRHALLLPPTVNIGTIQGGQKVNMVPDQCSLEVDIRYLPSMRADEVVRQVRQVVRACTVSYMLEITDVQAPIEQSDDSVWVSSLRQTLRRHHLPCRIRGSEGATVMSILGRFGFSSISFGFGAAETAHSQQEYIPLKNLYKGAQVLYDYWVALDRQLDTV